MASRRPTERTTGARSAAKMDEGVFGEDVHVPVVLTQPQRVALNCPPPCVVRGHDHRVSDLQERLVWQQQAQRRHVERGREGDRSSASTFRLPVSIFVIADGSER